MENKLGISNQEELKKIELALTNEKYKLINEFYTFNEETIFSVDFLEKLHIFLFNDIYDLEYCKIKESLSSEKRKEINEILKKLNLLYLKFNIDVFCKLIYDLWRIQMFYDGNTRTILSFLKIYNFGYRLNLNYDFEELITEDFFINKILKKLTLK